MDEQQEQQPGTENAGTDQDKTNNAAPGEQAGQQLTDEELAKQKEAKEAELRLAEAALKAKEAEEAKNQQRNPGILGRAASVLGRVTGEEHFARMEKRRQAFAAPAAQPLKDAVDAVNSFINAMHDCDADTPEEVLADTDVQQAAKRAREGLKVFTGETPVTFSKPTSDAHLNIGSGGAVTGNTEANKAKVAAVRDNQGDDEETAAAGVTNVPQPDAHVR